MPGDRVFVAEDKLVAFDTSIAKLVAPFERIFGFSILGAQTLTIKDTRGTDHLSFDAVGLPGFQFIQDRLSYRFRTHHTNMDVVDHASESDLAQAAVIMASFVYNAAMMDQRFPREARLEKK
jgi:Zn-dependent M28 family amino/carboxypeptidase